MVMSIGYNKFYKNTARSVEGAPAPRLWARLLRHRDAAAGHRVQQGEGLSRGGEFIEDIRVDCEVARKSLDREAGALRETGKGTLDGSWLVR